LSGITEQSFLAQAIVLALAGPYCWLTTRTEEAIMNTNDARELVYDLLADLGRVDVSFDVRLGGSNGATGRSSTTIAGVVELDRHAALTLGFQGSFAPMSWVVVGFDLRPVDHLEVTAGVGVPIPRSDVDPGDEVQPGLRVKAWF
jgi:hypothetical protein